MGIRKTVIAVQLAILLYSAGEVAEIMQRRGLAAGIDAMWMDTVINICIMIPLSASWPVFLLIWFARSKIRRQVAAWDERTPGTMD